MTVTCVISSAVALQFTDNASDEFGLEILRAEINSNGDCNAGMVIASPGASSGTGPVLYTDQTAQPETDYWYWAKAFNGAGDNGECSNIVCRQERWQLLP